MNPPTTDETRELWRAWRAAAAEPATSDAIARLYAELDAAVRAKGPTCWTSGKCCNFDAYGHRLYVTGLEIAWVVGKVAALPAGGGGARPLLPVVSAQPRTAGACVYQVDKLCSIHAVRPMGCRVFFCQEGTQGWQHELYETFLGKLRGLHEERGIEYRYMEWRSGLAEIREAEAAPTARG